jgi:hypothetical protein
MNQYQYVEDYIEVIAGIKDPSTLKNKSLYYDPIINLARYDQPVIDSMSHQSSIGQAFTAKQADLIVKIILKYRRQLLALDIDVTPLESPSFRAPFRTIDETKTIDVVDNKILVRFPFNQILIDELREFVQISHGHCYWNKVDKVWSAALTEFNLNWLVTWSENHGFNVNDRCRTLMKEIHDVETKGFNIELIKSEQGFSVKNAPDSLKQYLATEISHRENPLTWLIDNSAELGYTISEDLAIDQKIKFGDGIFQLMSNREIRIDHITADFDLADLVIKYAEITDRYPIVIFEPNLTDQLLQKFKEKFNNDEIVILGHRRTHLEVDKKVKLIHTIRPLTTRDINEIPLLITAMGMVFGGERSLMNSISKKVVYLTAEVYNKKKKKVPKFK